MKTNQYMLSLFFALATSAAGAFADAGRKPVSPETTPGDATYVYRITQPGSYYLDANLVGAVNKSGVGIFAGGVTLDLNGFSVVGTGAASNHGVGIYVNTFSGPVRILNGSVRNWKSHGVESQGSTFELDSVQLSDNGGSGLCAVGGNALVTRCTAEENGGFGFDLFSVYTGSQISNSNALRNENSGFRGGSVRDCSSYFNAVHGFVLVKTIESSIAYGNVVDGIRDGEQVVNCSALLNGRSGIVVTKQARVVGNNASGNGTKDQTGAGIYVQANGSLISGNECSENARGMYVGFSSYRNRIEDNHFTDNKLTGLFVGGQNNIIVRNTARNPSGVNWNIGSQNRGGAFVASPAITGFSGSTGGTGSGTTDPFANLSH